LGGAYAKHIHFHQITKSRKGVTMIEYALIAVVAIVARATVGTNLRGVLRMLQANSLIRKNFFT
jgi:Flp pilus assembly pilin Flp